MPTALCLGTLVPKQNPRVVSGYNHTSPEP